ncbi:hypothetical protein EDB81DRAFT_874587 [Dactylonectria macrodidyma]|uniref:Uncharacterized protein n=1 Tax=Dactylonectria macrodidyma TaxID=307937 RepID=A0A9P9FSQ3_9HYPO|nr:hypothetical protein EDB81DRAFT_874587 [Dactylonectria macrodidyma]
MSDSFCPALKVFIGDEWMTVEDASQTAPDVLREVLTDAFAFVSLTPHTVPRIQLGSRFRLSLQAERKQTPYRLQKIAEECQLGTVEKSSPEMKFFESGGIHALTALAAAGTDDKNVGLLLSKLPDAELRPVLRLVKSLKPHGDFQFMAEKRQVPADGPPLGTPTENWPEENYRIDLDTLLDGDNDLTGYYPIDLDNINLFAPTL